MLVPPGVLARRASERAIAPYHHLRPRRHQRVHLLDQGDREVCGARPLLALAHQPRQRQGTPFLDHMEQQRDAPAPDDTAIDDQHQRLPGHLRQQDLRLGDKGAIGCDGVGVHPSRQARDTTLGRGAIGHVRRDCG